MQREEEKCLINYRRKDTMDRINSQETSSSSNLLVGLKERRKET
jgi:hypothetical protein